MFWENRWHVIKIVCIFLNALDIIVSLSVGDSWFRVSRFFRAFYLVEQNNTIRNFFWQSFATEIKMLEFQAGLLFVIALWSVFGMLLFSPWNENTGYFTNFVDSFLAIMVMITTAKYVLLSDAVSDILRSFYTSKQFSRCDVASVSAVSLVPRVFHQLPCCRYLLFQRRPSLLLPYGILMTQRSLVLADEPRLIIGQLLLPKAWQETGPGQLLQEKACSTRCFQSVGSE